VNRTNRILEQGQALVRRLFEGKDFVGYVIDYRGVLGELNEAMETYNALEGYDVEDVAGTITNVSAEIDQLPQRHSEFWDVFKAVENKQGVSDPAHPEGEGGGFSFPEPGYRKPQKHSTM
jgi:hypothetical protein